MNLFLDTSCLFKLYHKEEGTEVIEQIFTSNKITSIYLSEVAKIEFTSTVWKNVRMGQIANNQAETIMSLFDEDLSKYTFVPIDSIIIEQAKNLIIKYGQKGLRSLDSIQLSTSISLKDHVNRFLTTDKLLYTFFIEESLPV